MDDALADALNQAFRTIAMRHRAMAGTLLGRLGLHPGQEVLLLELDANGPRTQAQLATASGCEAPTITHSARKLEDAGLIVRRPSPDDRRVTIVELSERGQALMPALRRAWRDLAEHSVDDLSAAEISRLLSTLEDLAARLDRA